MFSLQHNKMGILIVYWVYVVDLRFLIKIENYRYYLTNNLCNNFIFGKTVFAVITYLFVVWIHV
jgi:hypothetical protein